MAFISWASDALNCSDRQQKSVMGKGEWGYNKRITFECSAGQRRAMRCCSEEAEGHEHYNREGSWATRRHLKTGDGVSWFRHLKYISWTCEVCKALCSTHPCEQLSPLSQGPATLPIAYVLREAQPQIRKNTTTNNNADSESHTEKMRRQNQRRKSPPEARRTSNVPRTPAVMPVCSTLHILPRIQLKIIMIFGNGS